MGSKLSQDELTFASEQLLELIGSQRVTVLFGVTGASVVMAAIALQQVPLWPLLLWLVTVAVGQALRMKVDVGANVYKPRFTVAQQVKRCVRIAALCGSVQALSLIAFPFQSDTGRTLVTLILLGLVTGAIANSAGHHRIYLAYCVPIMVPLTLLWALCPGTNYSEWTGVAIGMLLIGFSATMLMGYARAAWGLFEESCAIRFRERGLNDRLQQALRLAEQASRAKTRFLAAASHDLRQPLHAITLLGAALGMRVIDERSREIANLMNRVLASLSSQLDGLLDISKLDAGVVEVHRQVVRVAALLEQHHAEFAPLASAKQLAPLLRLETTTAHIDTDPVLLLRVLSNLTQNAIKFTQRGSITLEAREAGGELTITVADTGCGIDPRNHDEVFQEFFQVSNQERDAANGLGLGLSIVRRVAQLLGITVELQSTPNLGTVVSLRMPTMSAPLQAHPTTPTPPPPLASARYGLKVLVIDDEVSVRNATTLLLEELACPCLAVAGIAEALQKASGFQPDFMIADFRLKEESNGIDAIAAIRAVCGDIPAVLVSGDTAPERLALAHAAGLRILHKPLALNRLSAELAEVWNARKETT